MAEPDAAGRPDRPDRRPGGRTHRQAFETPGGTTVNSFILQPTPLTAENLQLAVDAGQITKEDALRGRRRGVGAPAACQ